MQAHRVRDCQHEILFLFQNNGLHQIPDQICPSEIIEHNNNYKSIGKAIAKVQCQALTIMTSYIEWYYSVYY